MMRRTKIIVFYSARYYKNVLNSGWSIKLIKNGLILKITDKFAKNEIFIQNLL